MRRRFPLHSPAAAAFLSFLFPGLGQAAAGKPRRGLIVAVPMIAVLVAIAAVAVFARHAIYDLLSQSALTAFLLIDIMLMVYRLWAIVDAYRLVRPAVSSPYWDPKDQSKMATRRSDRRRGAGLGSRTSQAAAAILIVATLTVHLGVASIDIQAQQTLSCSFNASGPCIPDIQPGQSVPSFDLSVDDTVPPDPSGSVLPSASAFTPDPSDKSKYPLLPACTDVGSWSQRNCTLYLLLIGGDAGIGRGGNYDPSKNPVNLRTDTMILLQVDLSNGRSAMYSIPRNLVNVPLGKTDWNAYPYHFFPAIAQFGASARLGCGGARQGVCLFNAMWVDAAFANPGKYPYSGNYFARATKAVEESVGALMGVNVSGTVVVDLRGFVDLINAIAPSGLKINSPYEVKQIAGTPYTNSLGVHLNGLDFPKGTQTLKGEMVLAYARLRHVTGHDSDNFRTARQQLVLNALLAQVNPCEAALNISSVLSAVKGTVWTDLDWADAPALAAVAARIKTNNVKTYSMDPSHGFGENVFPDVGDNSVLTAFQSRVSTGLNDASPAYTGGGSGGGGGGFSC